MSEVDAVVVPWRAVCCWSLFLVKARPIPIITPVGFGSYEVGALRRKECVLGISKLSFGCIMLVSVRTQVFLLLFKLML